MKTILVAFVATLFVMLCPRRANAADGSDALPDVSVELPPEVAACVRACTASASSTADHADCKTVDPAVLARIDTMARELRSVRWALATSTAGLARHERRITALETLQLQADARDSRVGNELDKEKAAVADLKARIYALEGKYATLLENKIDELKRSVIAPLAVRVDTLERKPPVVRLGIRGGLMVFNTPADPAQNGAMFYGSAVGPRLTLALNEKSWLAIDAAPVFSFVSSSFLGSQFRAAYGLEERSGGYAELGASSTWIGYNDRFKARAVFLAADITLGRRFDDGFFYAATISGGPVFGRNDATGTLGLGLGLGFMF